MMKYKLLSIFIGEGQFHLQIVQQCKHMLYSTKHICGARKGTVAVRAHYMASTTIHRAPVKRGAVPSGLTVHMYRRVGWVVKLIRGVGM